MISANERTVCPCCQRPRHGHQIEADGVCDLCHVGRHDDPTVGTEFDPFEASVALWRRDARGLGAPANGNAATAPMRATRAAR